MSRILQLVDRLFRAEPREWYRYHISDRVDIGLQDALDRFDYLSASADELAASAKRTLRDLQHMNGTGLWDRAVKNVLLIEIEHDPDKTFGVTRISGHGTHTSARLTDTFTGKRLIFLVTTIGTTIELTRSDGDVQLILEQVNSRRVEVIMIRSDFPDERHSFPLVAHSNHWDEYWPSFEKLGFRMKASILPYDNRHLILDGFYRHLG